MQDRSVKVEMKTWLPVCLLGMLIVVPACRSTAPSTPPIVSEPTIPDFPEAQPPKPNFVLFVDRPELQAGTGPMDSDASLEFTETSSGLKYRILRKSDGKKPTAFDTVSVHYRGWLNNGKVFDNSYDRGEATTFPLDGVIAGWTEGMQLIGEGGMIELWVPSYLGYGERGSPGSIPAHAILHFIVELESVK